MAAGARILPTSCRNQRQRYVPIHVAQRTFHHGNINRLPDGFIQTQLGVSVEDAVQAGLGYSCGTTLRKALDGMDVFPGEIETSPLFNENGTERLAGQLVLPDRDFTGGVLWITSLTPRGPRERAGWPARRPRTWGLRGRRPYLFGTYSVPNQAPLAVLTDDPRLYLILAAKRILTFLTLDRNDAAIIGRMVARRSPRRLAVAMHNRQLRLRVAHQVADALPRVKVALLTRDYILAMLEPSTGDLKKITDFEPEELPPLRENREVAPEVAVPNDAAPEPSRVMTQDIPPDPSLTEY